MCVIIQYSKVQYRAQFHNEPFKLILYIHSPSNIINYLILVVSMVTIKTQYLITLLLNLYTFTSHNKYPIISAN